MLARTDDAAEATRKPSLVDDAYRALKDAIPENTFPPGYQGSEQEIATRLGMSRTPVHEAVIRLQEEGLVRVLPRRGVVIAAISADDMREIYEVMIALESAAAELLAGKPESERLPVTAELESLNVLMKTALEQDDLSSWARADGTFHQSVIERCGNGRLARMFHTIMDQSHRARMLTLRLRPKPTGSVGEHRAILEAIRDGNVSQAGERAKRHRARARDELLPLLGQLGLLHL
jgi:DNA-binding GntR family transcriptional regulator